MKNKYELIVCIVNAGYSDTVMDTARQLGAGGGTVLRARGTANPEAETFFNISITPEKEMVLILVSKAVRDDILHGLYKTVGLNTSGAGIAFSMPVDNTIGLSEQSFK